MSCVEKIKQELKKYVNAEKAAFLPKFFQAFEGGYGEGDRFLGVVVPDQRKVARKYYKAASIKDIEELLNEPYHEYRLTALIHKAVGWMLREIGNRDFEVEYDFLKENYKAMPRTMLRYAIEKFEPDLRQNFLKGLI
ncbi:DNA alkylation repair protein [Tepidanaerobacter sp. GT38]|uniref:DNA alkylation repair protein n=1 Tax=Tepidanaerobacter sp. GT38 TaxID=2722793 RepID=UPI001F4359A4|nr:DNA alkylation repair protein [Tepidanaerobacter sp. GT38]MCG1012054.1 DNA alkylation repair protein [Tepidanaerobacter sp. GT38]